MSTVKPWSAARLRARSPWANPRQRSGVITTSGLTWRVMKVTSRSRRIGISGLCTAPSRARATITTTVSSVVGSCQETTVPRPIPCGVSAAATPAAASWSWRAVSDRP